MILRKRVWIWSLLVFLSLGKGSLDQSPFEIADKNPTAKEGSCITFSCYVTTALGIYNLNRSKWFWILNGTWVKSEEDFTGTIIYSNTQNPPPSYEIANRVTYIGSSTLSQYESCSLTMNNLQITDSGRYFFRLKGPNKFTTWTSKPLHLTVQENPCQVTLEHPPVLKEGDVVSLRCYTSSSCNLYPELDVPEKTVHEIDENGRKNTRADFTANRQHDGKVVECRPRADQQDPCLHRTATLTVKYAPAKPVAAKDSSVVKEGDTVILSCSSRGNPTVSFSWYKDGLPLTNGWGKDLKFSSISASDSGKYHCQAENDLGKNASNILDVDVKHRPVGVTVVPDKAASGFIEGAELTLECAVTKSNPDPNVYTWYQNNKEYRTGKQLFFSRIKIEDSGKYSCKAANGLGNSTSKNLEIKVQYKPRNIHIRLTNQVRVNHNLRIGCEADSHPKPHSYLWYHRDDSQDSSQWKANTAHENSIHVEHAQIEDGGCYMCSAINIIGKGNNSSSSCIKILYGPTKPVLSMVTEAREGEMITIGCSVQSFPPSHLSLLSPWQRPLFHRGSEPSNSRQASFNVTLNHAGLYTCKANNSLGFNSTRKELVVTYTPRNVTISVKPGTEVSENRQLDLSCSALSQPPVASFTWTKTTATGTVNLGTHQNLTIESLVPTDNGLYSCAASNAIGTGMSKAVEIKVKYAPKRTDIIYLTGSWQHDWENPMVLSCVSHSAPPVTHYQWFRTLDGVFTNKPISQHQNLTVYPNQPGRYNCFASNEISGKGSETVVLFFNRGFMHTHAFIILLPIILLTLLFVFMLYRYKRNKSAQQPTPNMLPCCPLFPALGRPAGTQTHLESEAGISGPHSSRDDLLPDIPYRPKPQLQRPSPDSTSTSNINVVYSFLSMPFGKQGPSPCQPMGEQNRHTEDDVTAYATLNLGHQLKSGPKIKSPKNDVYAKVAKSQEQKKKSQEEYENIKGAHATLYPIPDSEEVLQINYSVVSFKKKPGHKGAHKGHRHGSDEEDKTQYSVVKI